MRRTAALRGSADRNYTAERAVQALEILAQQPGSAPAVARELGVADRTARRILKSLAAKGYVEPHGGCGRARYAYVPTVRILAMAAKLAERLPLVTRGQRVVEAVANAAGWCAYLVVPCYAGVVVVASAGTGSMRPWTTIAAGADAGGLVLLAYREGWRRSLAQLAAEAPMDEDTAASIRDRGHALAARPGDIGSLAVAVHTRDAPLAALALRGAGAALIAEEDRFKRVLSAGARELTSAA